MKKVLIANRGEIAARIMKTCHEMGIETVAVYSDADQELPFVKNATVAHRIGEPPVMKSYLQMDKIIEVAEKEQVDAIHPGYGFLSENATFAKAVAKKGIVFIGPTPEVISLMGDKVKARQTMIDAGVPVVPGSEKGIQTVEEALKLAKGFGYPVMLKASGGGGGIGMVCCHSDEELQKAFQTTKSRAKSYFGNDEMFIEKFIPNARHIEVQIFGDHHGKIVHLFERDCSIQRRNQKVIEETPSPFLSEATRKKICHSAKKAAEFVGYTNAGTIEFIVDEQENFYFLEMNTRLQVEHAVTEIITNLDLVKWQLLVARGDRLPLAQNEIMASGHSIEFRVYAEDPIKFFPSPGKIEEFTLPQNQKGVRIDSGYAAGTTVTPFYDPMVAKIIVKADNRPEAIQIAKDYFNQIVIKGIKTNIPLFQEILNEGSYTEGEYNTNYISLMKKH
ncbi:acetyl-CoA carboxylase biotin carboxylase subunit [Fredinandcohnia sp. QZ13]|uniref:acetyl-CoA carboxylase biotin carboxylase subunit n=1 Tax=Fredinandcohnia sp. QZ13 TaxID=3073144 RepID=UPI0028535245|nr:acetyl-CoA carboxylase biotin carboxylase subunit [Fredinandcohnia sp. QZ13]MDR4886605.1 acetyl-CoA carboxylase biotin carboxylase subunit [Fredinandcohnia sp. QZ13]